MDAADLGAQALVRDIVSGIFFLLDDAFRVGEYIEIGTLRGTVESISVRSFAADSSTRSIALSGRKRSEM